MPHVEVAYDEVSWSGCTNAGESPFFPISRADRVCFLSGVCAVDTPGATWDTTGPEKKWLEPKKERWCIDGFCMEKVPCPIPGKTKSACVRACVRASGKLTFDQRPRRTHTHTHTSTRMVSRNTCAKVERPDAGQDKTRQTRSRRETKKDPLLSPVRLEFGHDEKR